MKPVLAATSALALGALLALVAGVSAQSESAANWTVINPPPGIQAPAAQWMQGTTPSGQHVTAVVVRPSGPVPTSAVVVLHGASGFSQWDVDLAVTFAQAGFVSVAACWHQALPADAPPPPQNPSAFPPGFDTVQRIDCPAAPAYSGQIPEKGQAIRSLLDLARAQPGVQADHLGVFGMSDGAIAALLFLADTGEVQAIVAASGRVKLGPDSGPFLVQPEAVQTPILLLYGTEDSRSVLGHDFEAALRSAGQPVDAHYYEGIDHFIPFYQETQADVRSRAIDFFSQHLGHTD
jgi:dienelactone hydrolase